jgi:hypothetical protein
MPFPLSTPYLSWELAECLEILYEILDDLEDIRFALEKGRNPDFFLFPNLGFDPFQTIGKY